MSVFSAASRSEHFSRFSRETYDLLVIGGGVTGAGIALDAAARGLKTLLVEKEDFAWGTSSRSTKLIHGGLRYLKQMELALVKEVGTERAIVYRNAPHVVHPERMLLPIVRGGSLGKTLSSIGLWVYDVLAGVPASERRKMLDARQTLAQEPLLRTDILTGGGLYFEYRTDDARLTIEILKTAVEKGAVALNYAEVTELSYDPSGQVSGATVLDRRSGSHYPVSARCLVNATGPWVDGVRQLDVKAPDSVRPRKRLHLTKGIHLVVPRHRLPLRQSAYFDVLSDQRMVFAIPRGQVTYLGTTDTDYQGDRERPMTTLADVDYVLEATNFMFPKAHLTRADVVSSWAGLRPLIHEEGKDPSELSRKDEIFRSSTGLLSIAGGKLTGYRKMAERIVDTVCRDLGVKAACTTAQMPLSGGAFATPSDMGRFMEQRIGEARQIDLPPAVVGDWFEKYGTDVDVLIEKAFAWRRDFERMPDLVRKTEVWYAIEHEMALTLNDYLIRRTGRLYFERPALKTYFPLVAEDFAQLLGWDESTLYREMAAFQREYEAVLDFSAPTGDHLPA
jgi:glycerol-3-phosphate dehydrogenase